MWGNCNLTLSNKLQELQNRAARILTSSSYDTDVEDLSKLRWRKLSSQREMQKAIMVIKSLNGLTPEYLSELFVNRSDVTEYVLRDSVNKLVVPLPRTNFLKNSFSYSGAVLWNSLYLLTCGRQNLQVTLVIYSAHFILLSNYCIFRHGIHVKQFLWFYFFGFGLDVGLDIVS